MTFREDLWFWTARILVGLAMVAGTVFITFVLTVVHTVWCRWRGQRRQQSIPEADRCWTCRGTGIGGYIEPRCSSCGGTGKKRYLR
jgi:hypothetical protein